MKINIVGKGIIPGMGILPPVYNIEKSETDVRRLTNFRNIRVYCSENGLLITKKNVDSFFKTKIDTTTTNVVKPKTVDGVERKVLIEQEQQKVSTIEVEDVVTTTDDVIVEEETPTPEEEVVVNEIESVIEGTTKEDEEELLMTEEKTVEGEESEEVVKEETKQPQTYSSKKKNRNKNRK